MEGIQKIQRYIENTNFSDIRYAMRLNECWEIANMSSALSAISLAFKYGQAKGYRAAKAEIAKAQRKESIA